MIFQTYITDIIQFLSDNFYAIILLNGVILSCLVAIIVVSRLREVTYGGVFLFIKNILFYTVVVGEIIIIVLCGYIYWMNYESKRVHGVTLAQKVLPETKWVKDKRLIYYILNNDLLSIRANGAGKKYLYEGNERIREYHLSPNQRNILIVTQNKLILLNQKTLKAEVIEDITLSAKERKLTKVIDSVKWSPRSDKFCYKVSMWSAISSLDNYSVYDLRAKKKEKIKSPTLKMPNFFWDIKGQNLYCLKNQSLNKKKKAFSFEILVYRIPISTLKPELARKIPSRTKKISFENLKANGIDLFDVREELSFGHNEPERIAWVSDKGLVLGIDGNDDFYYQRNKWMRRKLFRIAREPMLGDISYYQHKGGILSIKRLRWLPGNRYAVIEHSQEGLLILEPVSGKVGHLANGNAFGWHPFR